MAGFEGNDHHRRYNRWLRTPGEAEGKVVHSFFKLLEGCRMDPFLRNQCFLFMLLRAQKEGSSFVGTTSLKSILSRKLCTKGARFHLCGPFTKSGE